MSHKITIEISDAHYVRLVALTKRWAKPSDDHDKIVTVEFKACFMTGLKAEEWKSERMGT